MAYQQNIPQPNHQLSRSQSDLLNNFQALGTMTDPNESTITFPERLNDPAAIANVVQLFAKADASSGGGTGLFLQQAMGGSVVDLTNALQAQTGWAYLPSGILIQWGQFDCLAADANGTVIGFTIGFTNIFSVMATPITAIPFPLAKFTTIANLQAGSFNGLVYDATGTRLDSRICYVAFGN